MEEKYVVAYGCLPSPARIRLVTLDALKYTEYVVT